MKVAIQKKQDSNQHKFKSESGASEDDALAEAFEEIAEGRKPSKKFFEVLNIWMAAAAKAKSVKQLEAYARQPFSRAFVEDFVANAEMDADDGDISKEEAIADLLSIDQRSAAKLAQAWF